LYLNFTSSSANKTSGNSSTRSKTGVANSAKRGVEIGVWGLTLAVRIAVSVLIGWLRDVLYNYCHLDRKPCLRLAWVGKWLNSSQAYLFNYATTC
jgi:hypothetical protein